MLGMALAGMPIVIGYQVWLYRAFRQPLSATQEPSGY
jgi:cytochrome bd-type quinol oxidase subunit 2